MWSEGLCASLCGHHRECGRGPSNCQTPPSRRGSLNHAHFSLNFLLHGMVLKYLRKSKHTIQQPGVISRTAEICMYCGATTGFVKADD